MLEQLLDYDTQLFLYLNNLGSPTWDAMWLFITHELTFAPLYAVLLYLFYKKFGLKALTIFIVLLVIMITFTDQITNVFKRGFERPRPCGEANLIEHIRFVALRCGKYGFFSGHAANSMAAAVFAGLMLKPFYKNLIFMLLFWSALVAYSRIYVGVHYPIDIFCGFVFGGLTGFLFYRIAMFILKKYVLVTY